MKKYLFAIVLFAIFALSNSVNALDARYDEDGFLIDQPDKQKIVISTSTEPLLPPQFQSVKPENVKEGEIASCFDYYAFGEVDLLVSTDMNTYSPGGSVIIKGTIKNDNKYPISDITVRARIVKNIPNPDVARSEIISLEEFDLVKDITLGGGAEQELQYGYSLPMNAPKGQYQVLLFVYDHDRFNQAGISFTNDVTAAKLDFQVNGPNNDHIYLDQTRITVNDQPHNVMAFLTNHNAGPVTVKMPLVNPGNEDKKMTVTYDIYVWDSASEKNKINTKTETVDVKAGSETILEYVVENPDKAVYYVSISADNADKRASSLFSKKTISNIRFLVNGFDYSRINSVGVNTYPLLKNTEANRTTTEGYTLKSALLDQDNNVIASVEYAGAFDPTIHSLIKKFAPDRDLYNFKIVTSLHNEKGILIDEVEVVYDCASISGAQCPETQPENTLDKVLTILWVVIGLITLYAAFRVIKAIVNHNKKTI